MSNQQVLIPTSTSSQLWEALSPYATKINLKKKEVLIREGEVSQCLYYVDQGCLRSWFNSEDGKDVSFQFFFGGSFIASFESFVFDDKSPYIVESLLPSTVWSIPKQIVESHLDTSETLKAIIFQLVCERLREYQHLFLSRIKDTPQKRYEELIVKHPEIFQKIPQHYIASYLGITSVSLSRIRCRK